MGRTGICRACGDGKEKPIKGRGLCSHHYRLEREQELIAGCAPAGKTELMVTIDFSLAPHLLQGLELRAGDELRPLGNQILWELKQAEKLAAEPVTLPMASLEERRCPCAEERETKPVAVPVAELGGEA